MRNGLGGVAHQDGNGEALLPRHFSQNNQSRHERREGNG